MVSPSSPETIQDHVQVLFGATLWALASSWIANKYGFYTFDSSTKVPKISLMYLVGIFCLFIVLSVIVIPVLSLLALAVWSGNTLDRSLLQLDVQTEGWLNVMTISATAAALIGYFFALPQSTRHAVVRQTSRTGLLHNIMIGIAAWPVCYPIVVAIDQLAAIFKKGLHLPVEHHEQLAVDALKKTLEYPWLMGSLAFLIIFIVPVVEEMLFRGFLQTWLVNGIGRKKAIIASSILFASFHFSVSQGFDNLELMLSLFVLSCFLGYVYERQQSLWSSVALHATFNAVSVLAIFLELG